MQNPVESQILEHWKHIYKESGLPFHKDEDAEAAGELLTCECPFHATTEGAGNLTILTNGTFDTDCCGLRGDAISFVAIVHGHTRSQTIVRLAQALNVKGNPKGPAHGLVKVAAELAALPPLYRVTIGALHKAIASPIRLAGRSLKLTKNTFSVSHVLPPAKSSLDQDLAIKRLYLIFIFHSAASVASVILLIATETNIYSKLILTLFALVMLACTTVNGLTISALRNTRVGLND